MLIKSPNPKTLRGKSDKEEGDASAAILHGIQMLTNMDEQTVLLKSLIDILKLTKQPLDTRKISLC